MGERDQILERIALVDTVCESPNTRAERIRKVIIDSGEEISNWDTICFAVEYLSSQAVGMMPFIIEPMKNIATMVHTAHYQMGEEFGLYKLPVKTEGGEPTGP